MQQDVVKGSKKREKDQAAKKHASSKGRSRDEEDEGSGGEDGSGSEEHDVRKQPKKRAKRESPGE